MDKGFKDEIIKLRKEGLTYDQIKSIIGCSKSTISYHCRKEGLINLAKIKSPSEEIIVEMQTYYNECKSCIKVAKKFNYSKMTVLKYIITDNREELTEEERKKRRSESVISFRKRTKLKLLEHKGGKCECCGYNKCVSALEFHHLDPNEKDFTIGGKSWKFDKLLLEVDKCILVCSNCHREIHSGLREV